MLYVPEPTYNFEAPGIALRLDLWLIPFLASDKAYLAIEVVDLAIRCFREGRAR
jgi:hypothetical protein